MQQKDKMKLVMILGQVSQSISKENGVKLNSLMRLASKVAEKNAHDITEPDRAIEFECKQRLPEPWSDIYANYLLALTRFCKGDMPGAYSYQSTCASLFLRHFVTMSHWVLPAYYGLVQDLRMLAALVDGGTGKSEAMEECARLINKAFTLCITDRAPIHHSRKWGTYFTIGILFKTYFKLKSNNLCKNILRAVKAADLPDLEQFPIGHQITFRFYIGVLAFFNEDFKNAEQDLLFCFRHTPSDLSPRNRKLILHYLIPLRLQRGSLPSRKLLNEFSELKEIYAPMVQGVQTGDLRLFEEALSRSATRLIQLGTFLTAERSRGMVIRTLFKRVFLLSDKNTKLSVGTFQTALNMVDVDADEDEVECMLANMIFKGHIKGYLSHERKMLVLSQKDPFPPLEQA